MSAAPAEGGTVFLGTPGPLASGVLAALLEQDARLAAVVSVGRAPPAPAPDPRALPVAQPADLAAAAAAAGIDHLWSGGSECRVLGAVLDRLRARRVLVACLGTRLDAATLARVRHGFWNVHPSSLPRHRGPAPMFWQLRGPQPVGGVSVHRMDPGLDTGALGARAPLALLGGISEPEAELAAGRRGGELAAALLRAGARAAWRSQPRAGASREPAPEPADFRIEWRWTAERAWRFMRGARWRGQPFLLDGPDGPRRLADALELRSAAAGAAVPAPGTLEPDGDRLLIGLRGGALLVRVHAAGRAQHDGDA